MKYLVCSLNPKYDNAELDSVVISNRERPKFLHYSLESANKEAQELAISKPGEQFAVFQVLHIVETSTPKFVQKVFNSRGEIVLDKLDD